MRHTVAARAFEPTAHYAELRRDCPLHLAEEHDPPFYVMTRFADVVATLKDPAQWQNRHGPGVFAQPQGVLGTADEPAHGRHRRVLAAAFNPAAIDALTPQIEAICDESFDRWVDRRRGDFVADHARPFPALVIAELLGIGAAHREEFGELADAAVAALTGGDVDAYHQAKGRLEGHVADGVAERRATRLDGGTPPDDVLTRLTVAEDHGEISHEEMRHLGYQLLVAGHETTTSLLGMMLYRMIEQPALFERLRIDRSLLPTAIEEALRLDSPVHGLFRTNAEACTVHGVELAPDTKVQVVNAAANRDPLRFANPDIFDLDRPRAELGRHVAFGWGIHHCIGAPLARLSARVTFERILDRMDRITLDGTVQRNDSFVLHGLTALPIRWELTR